MCCRGTESQAHRAIYFYAVDSPLGCNGSFGQCLLSCVGEKDESKAKGKRKDAVGRSRTKARSLEEHTGLPRGVSRWDAGSGAIGSMRSVQRGRVGIRPVTLCATANRAAVGELRSVLCRYSKCLAFSAFREAGIQMGDWTGHPDKGISRYRSVAQR